VSDDAFAALGLPPRAGLTDDDVRAAWRRIAAATHPDRDDGGDPARFGAAAAAYALLRTAYGRGEALADLDSRARRDRRRGRASSMRHPARGRPGVLALRVLVAAGTGALAVTAAGWTPATVGVVAGALTWLAATARHDLPPRTRE
jgi:curved DNA-binding protein CbpA